MTIEQVQADVRDLSRAYLKVDTEPVFTRTVALRDRLFELLRGRQKPAQTRELYSAASWTLTLLAWISTDLGHPETAETHPRAAHVCADHAEHNLVKAWIASSPTSRPHTALETLPDMFGSPVKAELTAREFATALDARLTASAQLDLLVVPRLTDDDTPFTARSLTPDENHDVLAASCFTPFDEFWLVPWLIPHRAGTVELARRSNRHLTALSTSVSAVEIRFGVRNPFPCLVDGLHRILAGRS
jgi:hypothetical protein